MFMVQLLDLALRPATYCLAVVC